MSRKSCGYNHICTERDLRCLIRSVHFKSMQMKYHLWFQVKEDCKCLPGKDTKPKCASNTSRGAIRPDVHGKAISTGFFKSDWADLR